MGVPSAELPSLTSTHLPPMPMIRPADLSGRLHCWLGPLWQSQMISRVPSAELPPVASRQRPDFWLTSSPAELGCHAWARSEERRVGKEGRSRWSPYH